MFSFIMSLCFEKKYFCGFIAASLLVLGVILNCFVGFEKFASHMKQNLTHAKKEFSSSWKKKTEMKLTWYR